MASTRRRLLASGAGAAAVAGGIAIATGGSQTQTQTKRSAGATSRTTDRFGLGDVGIANFLLTVQRVELDLYRRGLASGRLRGRSRELFAQFARQEALHVARLERAVVELGTHTVRRRGTAFPLSDGTAFARFALTLEDIAASACLGQLDAIDTKPLREAVLAIHTTDARHASAFALLAGLDPTPDGALAQPADAATVLDKLSPILR